MRLPSAGGAGGGAHCYRYASARRYFVEEKYDAIFVEEKYDEDETHHPSTGGAGGGAGCCGGSGGGAANSPWTGGGGGFEPPTTTTIASPWHIPLYCPCLLGLKVQKWLKADKGLQPRAECNEGRLRG